MEKSGESSLKKQCSRAIQPLYRLHFVKASSGSSIGG